MRGRDYDVTYLNNKNAGRATVLVRGLGNYGGDARGAFEIAKADLVATYAGESVAWDESPRLVVEVTGFVAGEDESSAAGYEAPVIEPPSSLKPGASYELTPSRGAALDYAFTYVPGTLSVGNRPVTSDPVAVESLIYKGSEQVGVAAGEGFSVTGGAATDAGTYEAVATLDEGWSWRDGSTDPRTLQWSIAPVAMAATHHDDIPDQTHTGQPCKPELLLSFGDVVLVEGKDYRVSYADNVEIGQAKVIVEGLGNFEGTLEIPFSIVEASYALVSGPTGPVEQGSSATFTFERVGDDENTFAHFVGVEVDGRRLAPAAYDAKSGSVAITLKPGFTSTLAVGSHTLTALFDDGSADAPLKVSAPHQEPVPVVPQTGDDTRLMPLVLGLASAGIVTTLSGVLLRRRS